MSSTLFRPASWPISIKIPLVVAVLMIAIGAMVTERVLSKLSEIQDQNLTELSGAYLDGLSSLVLPHVLRDDIWEVFDAIERSKSQFENINIISTVVAGPDNIIVAASDPGELPTGSPIPKQHLEAAIAYDMVAIRAEQPVLRIVRDLDFQGQTVGKMMVTLDVSRQLAERWNVRLTLIATIAGLSVLMATIGYLLTRRMTRPMQVLAEHLDQSKDGRFAEISTTDIGSSSKEVSVLFNSYNSMIRAVNERDMLVATLHEEEKLAGLGRLAAAMAHEINNPLGGMLNVLETLKRHEDKPEIREKSLDLLERGLKSIGDVVQTSLVAYRNRSAKRRNLGEKDLADLRRLLRPEIHRRGQNLTWEIDWQGELAMGGDGTSVRQIALNLLLNASKAAGRGGRVGFRSIVKNRKLRIVVENSGAGIPKDLLSCLNDGTGQKKAPLDDSVGLGLWVICRLVQEMEGQMSARNSENGAAVMVDLPLKRGAAKHAA
jgi:signal transduction histidine kinase